MGKNLLLFIVTCFVTIKLSAQCGQTETIVICDMTSIDNNNDGTPDGIINLYQEYTTQIGGVLPLGTWFDPDFNFALNGANGDVYLWDLDNSTEEADPATDPINYYEFELYNTSCGTDPVITIQVHLGPFSGYALPPFGISNINVEVCDQGSTPVDECEDIPSPDIDLFEALVSLPSAHANGEWLYEGVSPNFVAVIGSNLYVTVPYQSGAPLVDEETFELIYRVPGVAPCFIEVETRVNISVVRQVFSGYASSTKICEEEIMNGAYNGDLNLTDDAYLWYEDIEGIWGTSNPYGQISSPGDSQINIKDVYDQIMAVNPRFGCVELEFPYTVGQRSGVCSDATSTVRFKIYEALRPFSQVTPVEYCETDVLPTSLNLYDLLEFTTENGVLYEYDSNSCTDWTLESGPSSLGLTTNNSLDLCVPFPGYSHLGNVNLQDAAPGTYVFQYTVLSRVNCRNDGFCSENFIADGDHCTSFVECSINPCDSLHAEVTIVIHPKNYAGEDTGVLDFCETEYLDTNDQPIPIDLISLLETNGIDDPIYVGPLGTWTDVNTGQVITSPYTLPVINGQQTFNFMYNTDTIIPAPDGCPDDATLSFTVYEPNDPGVGTPQDLCNNNGSVNLFDLLSWNPDNNGTWTGPNGYTFPNNLGTIDTAVADSGDYTYTVPTNGTCPEASTTFYVTIYQAPNTGADQMPPAVCNTIGTVDLLPLIDPTADTGGDFVNVSGTTGILSGSVVTVTNLIAGTYDFEYQIQGNVACNLQTSTITLTIETSLNPGTATPVVVCSDGNLVDLFNSLTGSPNTSGTWTGPGGYTSATNSAIVNPGVNISGDYVYTVPINGSCPSAQVSVNLTINPAPEAGSNQAETVCQSDGIIDLNTLIDPMADAGGMFIDLDATGTLIGNMFDVSTLPAGTYNFIYELPATAICNSDTANLSVTVLTVPIPAAINQTFCVNLGATISNLLIINAEDYNWYDTVTSTVALAGDLLLVNGEDYYATAVDSSGCESERIQIIVTLLPLSNPNCDDGVADGVSDNNDGENDTLDIGGLPLAYPNFEIEIFNRYGTIVYKGNINTNPFDGSGNVSLTLGKKLPTGVYFYVFNPKDGVTEPFQGDFYLSR